MSQTGTGICRILDGLLEYWTNYLTSRSACMAIPPPAGFEALVVANQANATGTQQVPSLRQPCPVYLEPMRTSVVNV